MLWVPPGLAHGFFTVSDTAEFEYKVTDYYYPQYDRTLKWNDKEAAIACHSMNIGDIHNQSYQQRRKRIIF